MRAIAVAYALALVMLGGFFPLSGQAQPAGENKPHLFDDALVAPPPQKLYPTAAGERRGPSQFMAGDVAILVVLPESDGSVDPSLEDWTPATVEKVRGEVEAATQWWAQRLPLANLRFQFRYEIVPTSYEPTRRRATEEGLWVGETLKRLGYSGPSYFEQAYAAANAVRDEFDADWGTVLFVANSTSGDGYFADGRFAYAYINGPFLVVTSKIGAYGTESLDAVVAHELGHTFGALDQYSAARVPCERRSGYLFTPTTNSQHAGCGTRLPSIMIDAVGAFRGGQVDPATFHQLGYRDSDGDNLIDPLDTSLELELWEPSLASSTGRPVLQGNVAEIAFPSPVQQQVSLHAVRSVEYRVDGGLWQPATPSDGLFDETRENFHAELPLYNGSYNVEVRATNSAGVVSPMVARRFDVTWIGPAPHYGVSALTVASSPEIALALDAPLETSAVQVSESANFADASWLPFLPELRHKLQLGDGHHSLYLRFRDQFGLVSLPIVADVVLDTEPPHGTATRSATAPTLLLLDARDATTGVSQVEVRVGDSAPVWMAFSAQIELPGAGADQRVSVRFRDGAGNISNEIVANTGYRVMLPLLHK